jgi:hypothetical protein
MNPEALARLKDSLIAARERLEAARVAGDHATADRATRAAKLLGYRYLEAAGPLAYQLLRDAISMGAARRKTAALAERRRGSGQGTTARRRRPRKGRSEP